MSPVQEIIAEEWRRSGALRDDVFPGEFVAMPDHFHGLIHIEKGRSDLGHVVGAFKAAVARRIRRQVVDTLGRPMAPPGGIRIWHRNYYETIVRTPEAERNIRAYIRMNPWRCVQAFGNGLRGMGNPTLWNQTKIGVLASRGDTHVALPRTGDTHVALPRTGDTHVALPSVGEMRLAPTGDTHALKTTTVAYFGGFHSPIEREILGRLLACECPVICCPAWGLDTLRIPPAWIPALEQNRMLILEMLNCEGDLAAAEQRNRFVLEHADSLWLPHITPGGMLDRLLDATHTRTKCIVDKAKPRRMTRPQAGA